MKIISLLTFSVFCSLIVNSQSNTLKGTILPTQYKSVLISPSTNNSAEILSQDKPVYKINNIVLVGGRMDPKKGGNVILPNSQNSSESNYVSSQILPLAYRSYVGFNGPIIFQAPQSKKSVVTVTTDNKKTVMKSTPIVTEPINKIESLTQLTTNSIQPLIANDNKSLTDNRSLTDGFQSLVSKDKEIINTPINLTPLTDYFPKAENSFKPKETVDPALMSLTSYNPKYNNKSLTSLPELASLDNISESQKIRNNESLLKMPELGAIEGTAKNKQKGNTPELAPIEGIIKSKQKELMPELATIEGTSTKNTQGNLIPELAPIEKSNEVQKNISMIELAPIITESSFNNNKQYTGKQKTGTRGYNIPNGTSSSTYKSILFKPTTNKSEESINAYRDEVINSKPSAGGGMGMPALAPIEYMPKVNPVPELAAIDEKYLKKETNLPIPELAPIESFTRQEIPRKELYVSIPNQAKSTSQAIPNQHYHTCNCLYCQKYVNAPQKKKPTTTKKYTSKKPTSNQKIVYIYRDAPQPTQPTERIVYVPAQENQQYYQQPQPQPQKQEPQKIIYRDYTNTYNNSGYNKDCNCPQQGNRQTGGENDVKKYYNPNNYSPELTAGPTSGDYPLNKISSNINMRYSFYLTDRGKYSVGVYNESATILLSQNGKVLEYKINADPNTDPYAYNPKKNFFGSPESIGGVPIEYNYNRSVHKIGNIKFEYDFEGFFKTVGSSKILYTSRSSLAKVDGIGVSYDSGGNVTGVDPNNGIISYNPENQSSRR